jgi:hypothetical protein
MRKLAIAVILILMSEEAVFPQVQKAREGGRQQQPAARRQNVPLRRAAIQDAIEGFYVTQFRQLSEVSDEVFVKVLPFLEQFVRERFEITQGRRQSLNQLRTVVDSGGSDDDIRRLVRELDEADSEIQTTQQTFMRNVDPLLNTRQQGKLRLFLDLTDQQIRRMLTGIQNATQPNRPANQKN